MQMETLSSATTKTRASKLEIRFLFGAIRSLESLVHVRHGYSTAKPQPHSKKRYSEKFWVLCVL
jgi:hypothetical protein